MNAPKSNPRLSGSDRAKIRRVNLPFLLNRITKKLSNFLFFFSPMERWYLCGCAKVIFVQKKKSKKKIQGNEKSFFLPNFIVL